MKKQKNCFKEAVVILLAVVLVSSTIAIANTNQIQPTLYTNESGPTDSSMFNAVAWDNGMGYKLGVLAAQLWPGDIDAFPADDFELSATYEIDTVIWQGGYYRGDLAGGGGIDYYFDWNITFYNHNASGNKPGSMIKEYSFDNSSITREFWWTSDPASRWYANYSVTLVPPIKLQGNTRYWIGTYGYNATWPQSGWSRHNETAGGIKLHEGMFRSDSFGFPDWVNVSVLVGEVTDFNYQLEGTLVPEPVLEITSIKGPIGVTATINNSGDAKATNVTATIEATGGIILSGASKTVKVGDIDIGKTAKARSLIIGFGKPTIEVTVTCDEGITTNATYVPKFLFIIFIL